MRLAYLICSFHSSGCGGHYHLVRLKVGPLGLLQNRVDCPSSHTRDLSHATLGIGSVGDQRVGRVPSGGSNIAGAGGHPGNYSADRCLCRVLQISPNLRNSLNSTIYSRRCGFHTIYSDRSGTDYRSLDCVPADLSHLGTNTTGTPYRANHDLSDGRPVTVTTCPVPSTTPMTESLTNAPVSPPISATATTAPSTASRARLLAPRPTERVRFAAKTAAARTADPVSRRRPLLFGSRLFLTC